MLLPWRLDGEMPVEELSLAAAAPVVVLSDCCAFPLEPHPSFPHVA